MTNLWFTQLRPRQTLTGQAQFTGYPGLFAWKLTPRGTLIISHPDPHLMPGDNMCRSVLTAIGAHHLAQPTLTVKGQVTQVEE